GKTVILPIVGREIPIVADDYVDMEFGSGAVKITPAHDPNDFEIGNRHNLPRILVMNEDGTMNENAGKYNGMDRFACRKQIVKDLQEAGILFEIEEHLHSVGHSERSGAVVEPYLSTQWFVKMKPLAEKAIELQKSDEKVNFVPDRFEKTYFRWMENIHDWCISRQLWWGHRIPAWHCSACGQITVVRDDPSACAHCGSTAIEQDPDVLDTWFSSGLWPLTCLGWPEPSADLQRFYPTALMETGWDILFFWVARMMMLGLHLGGDVPFRQVFLHSMVLGEDGRKMSKMRGNVVDPSELIEQYGADSLRFYLSTMAGQGEGIIFSRARVEGYRNFCNKLWNAARFALMNLEDFGPAELKAYRAAVIEPVEVGTLSIADRWILARALETAISVDDLLTQFRLDLAAHAVYQFVWYELCDWYLELAKLSLREGASESPPVLAARRATQGTLATVFDLVLRVLHPIIPF